MKIKKYTFCLVRLNHVFEQSFEKEKLEKEKERRKMQKIYLFFIFICFKILAAMIQRMYLGVSTSDKSGAFHWSSLKFATFCD